MNAEQRKVIEQLYMQMYDMLITYARCSLSEEALAEEAVQETFRIACQKPEELCNSPNPKGWLVNTLKFTIQNMKRSRENARQILSEYLSDQSRQILYSDDKVSLDILYENVSDLEAFKLLKEIAIDGKSHLEIAKSRGISVSACKKRVQRAKELLQKKLFIDVTE